MSPNTGTPGTSRGAVAFMKAEAARMKASDGMSPAVSIPISVASTLLLVLLMQQTILLYQMPAMALSLVFGALVSIKDLKQRRVPDAYTLPWTAGLLAALAMVIVLVPQGWSIAWQTLALIGVHVGFYGLLLLGKATSMGDLKLSLPLGLLLAPLGLGPMIWAVALAGITGLIHGLVLKRQGHSSYPAAPHMVVAALLVSTLAILAELSQVLL